MNHLTIDAGNHRKFWSFSRNDLILMLEIPLALGMLLLLSLFR